MTLTASGPAVVHAAPVGTAALNGFLLVDKPSGLTSQQVVSRVKRSLGVRKAGHAGTLDPMATGLLVVGVGRGTRLLGYLLGHDKRYRATIRLGQATDSDDAEGTPVGQPVDATGLADQDIMTAIASYRGQIEQVPSAVSAIKVAGQRAYALARQGQVPDLPSRAVTVSRFDMDHRTNTAPWSDLDVTVDCSSGTYIRALARDLGRDLGVGGHLTTLRRLRIGNLDVDDAVPLDEVATDHLHDLAEMASLVAPRTDVDQAAAYDLACGRTIDLPLDGLAAVCCGPELVALCRPDPDQPGRARPQVVFTSPAEIGNAPNVEREL